MTTSRPYCNTRSRGRRGSGFAQNISGSQKHFSMPRAAFQRLARECFQGHGSQPLRYQGAAFEALQEACENYMTNIFSLSGSLAKHAGRKTITEKDLKFACELDASILMNARQQ